MASKYPFLTQKAVKMLFSFVTPFLTLTSKMKKHRSELAIVMVPVRVLSMCQIDPFANLYEIKYQILYNGVAKTLTIRQRSVYISKCDSLTSRHKITQDLLKFPENQSIVLVATDLDLLCSMNCEYFCRKYHQESTICTKQSKTHPSY